jgi:hypothetical protein
VLKDVTRRRFDVVAAWSVDRLGRSLTDLLVILGELHAKGVDLYLHRQGVDTTTPAGKAVFQIMGVFTEFEHAMIQERIRTGIARARVSGTKSGAQVGRARVAPSVEAALRQSLAKGTGIIGTAKEHGVGVWTRPTDSLTNVEVGLPIRRREIALPVIDAKTTLLLLLALLSLCGKSHGGGFGNMNLALRSSDPDDAAKHPERILRPSGPRRPCRGRGRLFHLKASPRLRRMRKQRLNLWVRY